ncbi:MAG: FAD-binding protein [Rhodobacterales bacterium]|nr:FAD-binding protein [Rhodobacterales bacterium]
MADDFDHEVDLLAIGSGAAGMSAALRAHDLGARALIVEASSKYGGSTAISGGVVWIANNHQMPSRGVPDSVEEAMTYLRHQTQGEVPEARLAAYVEHAARMLVYLEEKTHFRLDSLESYSDYYPEAPGGKPGGRSMEPVPFDASLLGEDFALLRRSHPQSQVMGKFGITAREAHGYLQPTIWDLLKLASRFVQYGLRYFKRKKFGRDTKLHAGNALIGRLRLSLKERQVPLWLNSPAVSLIQRDGRVLGAVVERDGERTRVRALQGVVLAAGGFEQNQQMREQYLPSPTSTSWNAGNPHNKGAGIRMGESAGGALERMHDTWWTPVTRIPKSEKAWVLVVEKNLPGTIFVNKHAKRFTNEAAPYLEVGLAMYAGDAVPVCWMIFDARVRHQYPIGPCAPGYAQPDHRISRRLREEFFTKADSLDALAQTLELDADVLQATVTRFNGMAVSGVDEDFCRGESLADRYYGDRRVKPNASLAPIVKAPFYAIPVYPGDLGTKGGLVTDASARVLDKDGAAIPGLYAAGNCSAAVMGPTYPGAGGTIGPALTFGFLAAESAAEQA